MRLLILLSFLFHQEAQALTEVGLSPSVYAISRAEVMTASASPQEALYYNPALLAWKGVSIEIGAAGYLVDEDNARKGEETTDDKKVTTYEWIGHAVTSNKPTLIRNNLEAANLVFPYFAIKSFANARLFSRSQGNDREIDFKARFGLMAGLAISAGDFSIGYSYYLIKQADLLARPNSAQISTIRNALEAGTLDENTLAYEEFTTLNYGEAVGHNIGLSYRSSPINPSGFSVAVLNAGGTQFSNGKALIRGRFEEFKKSLEDEAAEHNLTLGNPKKIDQMVNTGIHLSSDHGKDDYFFASLSMDYQDIGGSTIDNKFAIATDFGFRVNDTLSLITSVPIFKHNGVYYYLGLSGLHFIGGYRPGEYMSAGADLDLHLGFHKFISIVRINLNGTIIKSLDENLFPDAVGFRIGVGLTFVFPDFGGGSS